MFNVLFRLEILKLVRVNKPVITLKVAPNLFLINLGWTERGSRVQVSQKFETGDLHPPTRRRRPVPDQSEPVPAKVFYSRHFHGVRSCQSLILLYAIRVQQLQCWKIMHGLGRIQRLHPEQPAFTDQLKPDLLYSRISFPKDKIDSDKAPMQQLRISCQIL